MPCGLIPPIHSLLQYMARLKRQYTPGLNSHCFTSLRIPATPVGFLPDFEIAETGYFQILPAGQGIFHQLDKNIHEFEGLCFVEARFLMYFLYEVSFGHAFSFSELTIHFLRV